MRSRLVAGHLANRFRRATLMLVLLTLVTACSESGDGDGRAFVGARRMVQTPPVTAAAYADVVQHLYVAYYGRPADPSGLTFWSGALATGSAPNNLIALASANGSNPALASVLDQFGNSAEAIALYGTDNAAIVTAIYLNLFKRLPEPEGLAFYVDALDAGSITRAHAAITIAAGAQGADALSLRSKIAAATGFTKGLGTSAQLAAYDGVAANAAVRAILASVDASSDAGAATARMLAGLDVTPDSTTLAMLSMLEAHIASERQMLWELLPRNPLIATQIEEKIELLSRPGLPAEIRDGAMFAQGTVVSMNGLIPVSAVYPPRDHAFAGAASGSGDRGNRPGPRGLPGASLPEGCGHAVVRIQDRKRRRWRGLAHGGQGWLRVQDSRRGNAL